MQNLHQPTPTAMLAQQRQVDIARARAARNRLRGRAATVSTSVTCCA